MNLLLIAILLILFFGLLYLGFTYRNIASCIGAGIIALFIGMNLLVSGTSVQKEECNSFVNQTVVNGNFTDFNYKTLCVNETIVPEVTGTELLVSNGLAVIMFLIGIGLILGKGVQTEEE